MADKNKCVLDLKEVKVLDVAGNEISFEDQKEPIAQLFYQHAKSLHMDEFARGIFKHGKAEVSDKVREEIKENGPTYLNHRVLDAILKLIDK